MNLRTYRPLAHQHAPEIVAALAMAGASIELDFVPVSAPLARGIFATAFFHVSADVSLEKLGRATDRDLPRRAFPCACRAAACPRSLPSRARTTPRVGVVIGSERDGKRLVTAFAALDNLVKGGAGQAIQNMNLMLGLPETLTLEDVGGYP